MKYKYRGKTKRQMKIFRRLFPVKPTSTKKKKEKDTFNQNSTENIKRNKNTEKELRNAQEKKTTGKVAILIDSIIKHLNAWKLSKK